MWTSRNSHSFLGVKVHYITSDWELKEVLIGFKKISSHKGVEASDMLKEIIADYGIEDKIISITTDNAGTNDTLFQNLITQYPNIQMIRCLAHVINLSVQDLLGHFDSSKEDDFSKMMPLGKVRQLVKKFRNVTKVADTFKSQCIAYQLNPRKLAKDMPVRWSSTYTMLDVFITFENPITTTITIELPEMILTAEDWKTIKALHKMLLPFKVATDKMSEESPTLSISVVIYNHLFDSLESLPKGPYKSAIKSASDKLSKYYSKVDDSPAYAVATILNPRLKAAYYKAKKWELNLASESITEMEKAYKKYQENAPFGTQSQQMEGIYAGIYKNSNCSELQTYLSSAVVNQEALEFWKGNESIFPILSKIARDYLVIQGATASIERTFSGGQDLITPNRCSLKPDTISKIMMLKSWLKIK